MLAVASLIASLIGSLIGGGIMAATIYALARQRMDNKEEQDAQDWFIQHYLMDGLERVLAYAASLLAYTLLVPCGDSEKVPPPPTEAIYRAAELLGARSLPTLFQTVTTMISIAVALPDSTQKESRLLTQHRILSDLQIVLRDAYSEACAFPVQRKRDAGQLRRRASVRAIAARVDQVLQKQHALPKAPKQHLEQHRQTPYPAAP